jgi:hypothetical protein
MASTGSDSGIVGTPNGPGAIFEIIHNTITAPEREGYFLTDAVLRRIHDPGEHE